MNMRRLVFFGVIATAIPLSAQIQANGALRPLSVVTGAPYSAIRTMERIQTLADGTHITQPGDKTVMYRDSAGRIRTEFTYQTDFPGSRAGDQLAPVQVVIYDSVAGFPYQFDLNDKVAQRFAMPASRPAANTQGVAKTGIVGGRVGAYPTGILATNGVAAGNIREQGNPPKATSESLGTQLVEGVTAEGTRRTTTFAVGTRGNDREIVVTNETWFSEQLQLEVLNKTSDPALGDTTIKLANISLVEPDPALFMPPPDYSIKDLGAAAP